MSSSSVGVSAIGDPVTRETSSTRGRVVRQRAVDAAGVGAFDWDIKTGQLDWDDRLKELFGYDAETFTTNLQAFNDRVHPDDLPRVTHALESALATCGEYA